MSPRWTGVGALLAAVAVAAVMVWRRPEAPEPPPSPADRPTSVFRGVEIVNQDPDGTRWRLWAEEGRGRETQGTGTLIGVRAEFERKGRRVHLTAGTAELAGGGELRLSGGVELSWDGYQARTPAATYRQGEGAIVSDQVVELRGPALAVRGRGLRVDVEGRRARIPAAVRAELAPSR